jgi:hypothetical protein
MGRLSPAESRSRLAFDFQVVQGLRSDHLGPINPFVSEQTLRAGSVATPVEGAAGLVRLYLVEYRFPVLVGEGKTTPTVKAKFDLLAGANYPYSRPSVTCIGAPLPWSPHVQPGSGSVCLGEGWELAQGHMLAGQLIVHVMRLLNCDEPDREHGYGGWNPPAVRYWRTVLKTRPLNPDLRYPILPADITHAVDEPSSAFRPVVDLSPVLETPLFDPVPMESAFLALDREEDGEEFRPLRL